MILFFEIGCVSPSLAKFQVPAHFRPERSLGFKENAKNSSWRVLAQRGLWGKEKNENRDEMRYFLSPTGFPFVPETSVDDNACSAGFSVFH